MTESARPAARRPRPSFTRIVLAALAAFLVVYVLLAVQLRSGHDPALGASATAPTKQVIVRRTVVTRLVPRGDDGARIAVPVTTTTAPAGSAPSAPVVTRSS